MSPPILAIEDFSVVYRAPGGDVRAVQQVNLELYPSEVVGLVGESGSGKSTLAYGACRLLRAPALITSGSVRYQGRRAAAPMEILRMQADDLRRLRWREIAIVFQSAMNALNPVLNVRDQLLDVIHAHLRVSRQDAKDKAASLLDLVGIPRARLRSYPHELSGGMRQRVMIAMALATDPEVVIMDEPTTALDVVVQRDILTQIVELKDRLGFSILFITHDLSLLLEMADRIAVMYAGRLLEAGTAAEISGEPAHPYTRGLLHSFPSLRGARRDLAGHPGLSAGPTEPAAGLRVPPPLWLRHGTLHQHRHEPGTGLLVRRPRPRDRLPLRPARHTAPGGANGPPSGRERGSRPVSTPQPGSDEVRSVAAERGPLAMEAISLSKDFRLGHGQILHAVREVSVSLYRGAATALVGESGSGKTTVARLLAGQERLTSGSIRLDGNPVDLSSRRAFRQHKSKVQLVFQDPFSSLNPVHTVRHHLERPVKLHQGRKTSAEIADETAALLEQVRLAPPGKFLPKFPL